MFEGLKGVLGDAWQEGEAARQNQARGECLLDNLFGIDV